MIIKCTRVFGWEWLDRRHDTGNGCFKEVIFFLLQNLKDCEYSPGAFGSYAASKLLLHSETPPHHKYKDREFRRKAQEMNEMIWCHSLHAKMQGIQQGKSKKFHHKQTMASLYYRVPLTAPLANTILSFYTITHYTNVILYVIITTYIDPTLFLYEPTISTNNKWSSFFSCDSIPLNDFTLLLTLFWPDSSSLHMAQHATTAPHYRYPHLHHFLGTKKCFLPFRPPQDDMSD